MSITNCATCGQYIDTDLHSECTRCGNEPMERFPATDEQVDMPEHDFYSCANPLCRQCFERGELIVHPDTIKLREAVGLLDRAEMAMSGHGWRVARDIRNFLKPTRQ